MFLILGV